MARAAAVIAAVALLQAGCGQRTPATSAGASPAMSAAIAAVPSARPASPMPTVGPTPDVYAGVWADATSQMIGQTADWTNKVEVADIDANGLPDLLFANGGNYIGKGEPATSRVFLNGGPGQLFANATEQVFGGTRALTRVIKVRDLNADAFPDIVLGTTDTTQSQLFLGSASGAFTKATEQLPQVPLSVGDLEIGDVDADGDPDIVLADWGAGLPMANEGAPVHLWLNDGTAHFTEARAGAMPATRVWFSWDIELVDVDNDWDLDLAVSSKLSDTSFLFDNDGSGRFTDVTTERMPHFTSNYEFEPMDLDGDGFLDLVTINDGVDAREHVFRNDGRGGYVVANAEWWPDTANPGEDDNVAAFVDVDSDGDADFVIGSLSGLDRLMINDGSGRLSLVRTAFDTPFSGGTLGIAITDLNDDGRPDFVEAQGETPESSDERVDLATDRMAPDTAAPRIRTDLAANGTGKVTVHARVTDGLSPSLAGRDGKVEVRWDGSPAAVPLHWYGEFLFRGDIDVPAGATGLRVCATDRGSNEACAAAE